MQTDLESTDDLVQRAARGEEGALAELFDGYRGRLRRMVKLRLDRRLQGRVDPSDVLQDAYLDLSRKLEEYTARPAVPFFLWLRLVVGERLLRVHRQHLGAAMRDAEREISLNQGGMPQASSASLAAQLLGRFTSASRAVARAEQQQQLQDALNEMDAIDREVIALRHFEELSNDEVATVLGLTKGAASKRYVRAMLRLKARIGDLPGFADGR
ncbi:MAG: sigma-70 family RNA polymerase sigma factor [Isosphaeraceae bacterium]